MLLFCLVQVLSHPDSPQARTDLYHTWLQLEQEVGKRLRLLEEEFWELNIPDPRKFTRLRILEQLTFREQAAGQETDLTDLLTDQDFPQTNNLGPITWDQYPGTNNLGPITWDQ